MTKEASDNLTRHPAQVPDERLRAAKEKAALRPTYDSGRARFDASGPRAHEQPSEFLRRVVFEDTPPCDMLTGSAYRSAGFDDASGDEFRTWIFVPDRGEGEPEIGYYASRLHLLVAQPCTHQKFLGGAYPETGKCPDCAEDGRVYPRTFQEELVAARAAEAAREAVRRGQPPEGFGQRL